MAPSLLHTLVASQLGAERASWLLDGLVLHRDLLVDGDDVPRVVLAQALGIVLLDDLLHRVPSAAAYADDRRAQGARLHLDHGAVRTVTGLPCGELAEGQESLARFLRPLGYAEPVATYDLARLRMTGRAWRHLDLPADVPQYFVSELHADRFSAEFREAAARVVRSSQDPLTGLALVHLQRLAADGHLPVHQAQSLLGELAACFARQHGVPSLADYETVRAESEEMAWIATEGTAFNHAADRVDDVMAVAEAERAAGRPIKDEVEVSGSGRVRQTAHRAAMVERPFKVGERATETRTVPGSFFELITRHPLPDGSGPDLAFDAANAQGIFTMTRGPGPASA
ncbi:MAG: hypothetical protein QOE93_544 [Actinomycetota bacterium]|nr:hypothetical protein [Actinomycetota bacterium]